MLRHIAVIRRVIPVLAILICCALFLPLPFFSHPDVAHASSNGLGQKPYMGWSSWSLESTNYSGYNTPWLTADHVKSQADVLHQQLQPHGYQYINIDAGWWMDSNWKATFDGYGRPSPYPGRFPAGISDVANYVHNYGLKLGIYYVAGLDQTVYNQNYPIYGTSCHAQDIAIKPLQMTNGWRGNYAIDYSNSCAQAYINSIANQFASWGVDFLKLDGVTPGSGIYDLSTDNRPDVQAWSQALAQSGRSIWFELSWALDHRYISFWQQQANGWRIDTDVECYCGTLVTWDNSVKARFNDVVPWTQNAGPGGWNDLDSLDVGSATLDGISQDERQSYMTLWAIEAAPLFSGDDLTKLDSYGLSLLTNDEVIAVDQSGHPARPLSQLNNQQVWYADNGDGTYTVALFNLDSENAPVTVNWSDLGISGAPMVRDLWSHTNLGAIADHFSASLNGHASRLLKVTPAGGNAGKIYEAEALANTLTGSASVVSCTACSGGQKIGNIGNGASLTFNSISVSASGTYPVTISYVDGDAGRSMQLSVNGGSATTQNFHGTNDNNWNAVQTTTILVNLNAGNNTIQFSSPSSGWSPDLDRLIVGSLIPASYEAEVAGNTLTGSASIVSCSACSGGQKVGNIGNGASLTFNNVQASTTGRTTLTIAYIDGDSGRSAQISINGGSPLTINFHGTNNNNWNTVQTLTMTISLNAGSNTVKLYSGSNWAPDIDRVTLGGNNTTEAEAVGNTLTGSASIVSCSACSGGQKVGNIGNGASLSFNQVLVSNTGSYTLTIQYIDGDSGRSVQLSVNGGAASTLTFHGTNDNNWNAVQTTSVVVNFNAGYNSIQFSSGSGWAPDIDCISIS
ncbi:hypothetical protein KSD_71750 [Ktedonobacter sp. SOSP1-85]|uniref:alpha-galactosidase D n=1 Tax=Ktedonobacter sp. SOSP1-85 TaxID=2778367 RepID=UPI001916BDD3|nr:carbohydrate-binding protein [Ktedonobacter sp. SOSP1-85]GHO79404.1 hypothetical protein KSD_71750 [Ktedonobacter sp. SOSP1-85]